MVRDNETLQPHGHRENYRSALEVTYLKLSGKKIFHLPRSLLSLCKEK